MGLALLASAAHPLLAPVLERVSRQRLKILTTLYAELGFPPADARHRALLAYSAYLGHAQLSHTAPQLLPRQRAARQAYLDAAISLLSSPPGPG